MQFADLVQKSEQLQGLGVKKVPKISWSDVQHFQNSFIEKVPESTEENLAIKYWFVASISKIYFWEWN